MFCAHGLTFGCTERVSSRFNVLLTRTRFQRYRGRQISISSFARPDSFSAVPRASGLVFMFRTPGLVFGGIEGVGYRFHVLNSHTHFRRYRGRHVLFLYCALPEMLLVVLRASGPFLTFYASKLVFSCTEGVGSRFHILRAWTRFRQYRGCPVPFSCFRSRTYFRR
jgi:hypothetical protein